MFDCLATHLWHNLLTSYQMARLSLTRQFHVPHALCSRVCPNNAARACTCYAMPTKHSFVTEQRLAQMQRGRSRRGDLLIEPALKVPPAAAEAEHGAHVPQALRQRRQKCLVKPHDLAVPQLLPAQPT